jgi:UPF0176 protein
MPRFLTAALYQFVALDDLVGLRERLQAFCDARQIKGTLLLASEGINGTIAGQAQDIHSVLSFLRSDPRLAKLQHKESWSDKPPFLRMKVRIKKEIVTLGAPGVDPVRMAGQYVKPQDWNALISDPDVVLVDTRNDYELEIGSFAGAVNPRLKSFSELPEWIAQQEAQDGVLRVRDGKRPKVAMFCTGGIRCEKSTALLRQRGFDEVYHLEGGILKYLETVPAEQSLWQGQCFVFDERVSVGHGLKPGPYELCRSCRHPVGDEQRASPLYVKGVSCPNCHDRKSEEQKRNFAERHRQEELARKRGLSHVGARMPVRDRGVSEL